MSRASIVVVLVSMSASAARADPAPDPNPHDVELGLEGALAGHDVWWGASGQVGVAPYLAVAVEVRERSGDPDPDGNGGGVGLAVMPRLRLPAADFAAVDLGVGMAVGHEAQRALECPPDGGGFCTYGDLLADGTAFWFEQQLGFELHGRHVFGRAFVGVRELANTDICSSSPSEEGSCSTRDVEVGLQLGARL